MGSFVEGLDGRKLAVTVPVIRDAHTLSGERTIEVYVQERVSTMPSYPDITVFPGGGVDPRDLDSFGDGAAEPWAGPDLAQWALDLHVDTRTARGLLCGAVRELFEETGTLLASSAGGEIISDASPYHEQRVALEAHTLSLTQMLQQHNLVLRTDQLIPFSRWVTGCNDVYHYDVFSFLAVAPKGQEPDDNSREVTSTGWFPPGLVLEGWRSGLLGLALPTWAQLKFLSKFSTCTDALAAGRAHPLDPIIGDPVHDPELADYFNFVPPKRY